MLLSDGRRGEIMREGVRLALFGSPNAGKSSLLQALFRIVNIQAGSIAVDGRVVADIGLDVLRGRLALVPQDSLLFKGTLRKNSYRISGHSVELTEAEMENGVTSRLTWLRLISRRFLHGRRK